LIPWNEQNWGESSLFWDVPGPHKQVTKGYFYRWIERLSRYAVPLCEDITELLENKQNQGAQETITDQKEEN
jgi:hypothetical protein